MPEQNESRPVGAPDGLQSSTNPAASVTDVTAIRPKGKLLQAHIDELTKESAIDPQVVAERGYETIDGPTGGNHVQMERLEKLGIPGWALKGKAPWPGLLIPWYAPHGEKTPCAYQWKPRTPMQNADGKAMKYASQKGVPSRLDVHPRWSRLSKATIPEIRDVSIPLFITEGIKKGDALTSQGLVAVALNGVQNWRRCPDWHDIAVKGRSIYIAFDADARTNRQVRLALNALRQWLLTTKNAARVRFCLPPETFNGKPTKGVDDFFAAGATKEDFRALVTPSLPMEDKDRTDPFTDALMADRYMEEVLHGEFLYVRNIGWRRYTGDRWKDADDAEVLDTMRRHAIAQFGEAHIHRGELVKQGAPRKAQDDAQAAIEGWYSAQSRSKLGSALKLAEGIEGIRAEAGDFDNDPNLLNTPSGVVNLLTDETMPHDPALLLTKMTGVSYVPGAESAALKAALQSVPEEAQDWLQAMLGEAATGRAGDRMVLLSGEGDNGKTLLMGSVFRALGDYAAKVPNTLLTKNKASGAATPEKMTLQGVRLAYIEETPEDSYLDANVVKELLDAQVVEGRMLYKGFVSWTPTHSLFLNTNHAPTMGDTGHGAWRRVTRLDFPYKFVPPSTELEHPTWRHGDPRLKAAMLEQEAQEALLAWLVVGARRALEMGSTRELTTPAVVAEDTIRWRKKADGLLAFFDERMVYGKGTEGAVAKQDLFLALNAHLKASGQKPISLPKFAERLRSHSELAQHIQEKAKVPSATLSRPTYLEHEPGDGLRWLVATAERTLPPLAARTAAYVGIRFRSEDE